MLDHVKRSKTEQESEKENGKRKKHYVFTSVQVAAYLISISFLLRVCVVQGINHK